MDTTSDSSSSGRSSSSADQILNMNSLVQFANENTSHCTMLSHPMWNTPIFHDGRVMHQMPPTSQMNAPIRPQLMVPSPMALNSTTFANTSNCPPGNTIPNGALGLLVATNRPVMTPQQQTPFDHQSVGSAFRPVHAFYPPQPNSQPPAVTLTPATPITCDAGPNWMLNSPKNMNITPNNNTNVTPNLVSDPFSVEKYLDVAASDKSADSPVSSSLSPRENASFDGNAVLCQVCGDKASGFHYGVHACEGCKGFFRRSIQSKLTYRPCTKNQQCSVLRINRNRCQFCRLKKCIAVGMSRDSVRFGRVPKKEKEKIRLEMQRANSRSAAQQMNTEIEDLDKLLASVVTAHLATCQFTKDKMQPLMSHLAALGVNATPTSPVACPLNPRGISPSQDMSDRYEPAIRGVVTFAKSIPGFHLLGQSDQVTLLKAGIFEVLLLRLSLLFDQQARTVLLLDGSVYRRNECPLNQDSSRGHSRFLVDSLFHYVQRLNSLRLNDADLALYCATALVTPDRPGLRNAELVDSLQQRLRSCLRRVLTAHHPDQPDLYNQLIMRLPDLRTLNTLHQEKLLTFKINEQCCLKTEQVSPLASTSTQSPHSDNGTLRPASHAVPFNAPNVWPKQEVADSFDSGLGSRSMKANSSGSDTDSTDHCHVSPNTTNNNNAPSNYKVCTKGSLKMASGSSSNSVREKHQLVAQLLERKPQATVPMQIVPNSICFSVGAMDLSSKRAEPAHSSNSPKRRCVPTGEEQPLNLSMKKTR